MLNVLVIVTCAIVNFICGFKVARLSKAKHRRWRHLIPFVIAIWVPIGALFLVPGAFRLWLLATSITYVLGFWLGDAWVAATD